MHLVLSVYATRSNIQLLALENVISILNRNKIRQKCNLNLTKFGSQCDQYLKNIFIKITNKLIKMYLGLILNFYVLLLQLVWNLALFSVYRKKSAK